MFDTKFYKNRWRPLNFRRIWFFYLFFIVTSNYKNSMYPRSFLCEEAKIKQRTPLKKELCEIGEEAIRESQFTSFFLVWLNNAIRFFISNRRKIKRKNKKFYLAIIYSTNKIVPHSSIHKELTYRCKDKKKNPTQKFFFCFPCSSLKCEFHLFFQ